MHSRATTWRILRHDMAGSHYPRTLMPRLRAALADTPVVALTGPRQAGKSTLVRSLIDAGHPAQYVSLDDPIALDAARTDPDGFIAGLGGPAVIDEVQRAPDLFRAIKSVVDRTRTAGRFLLTGSADILLLPQISESLAGRMEVLTLWPLAQAELERRSSAFVDALFGGTFRPHAADQDPRDDLIRRALRGGYPEAVARADTDRRSAWFGSYVTTLLQRDVRDIADVEHLTALPRLMSLLAARAMTLLNAAEVSRAAGIPHRTLLRYLGIFETLFLVRRIPAWSGSLSQRVVRHPKLMLTDTGLLGHLQGVSIERFKTDDTLVGPLLENFVACEILKATEASSLHPGLYHFRTARHEEVDLVLEAPGGYVAGVEVKARTRVAAEDLAGLRALRQATRAKFRRGVVLHAGREAVAFGDDLYALPMTALWNM